MNVTWMIVAVVSTISQGITFRRCRPLHGSCICYVGGSTCVCEGHVQKGWNMWRRKRLLLYFSFSVATPKRDSCISGFRL